MYKRQAFVAVAGTATGTAGIANVENAVGGSGSFAVGKATFGDGLVGTGGVNTLRGGPGNDVLVGAQGDDTVQGEDGDDIIVWSNGDNSDVMDGGAGSDLVQVNGAVGKGDVASEIRRRRISTRIRVAGADRM